MFHPATAKPESGPRHRASSRPGNQPGLDRAQIAATALTLLEQDGFDAFSMRKLAATLGVKSPSLYWHVRSKDDLFDLIVDNILGECRLPPPAGPGKWKTGLTTLSRELRRVLLGHPACGRLFTGRIPLGPNGLRLAEYAIATFRQAGFDRRTASHGYAVLAIYTVGFAAYELGFGQDPRARHRLMDIADQLRELPAGQLPHLTEAVDDFISPSLASRFELGLTSLVNGFPQPQAS